MPSIASLSVERQSSRGDIRLRNVDAIVERSSCSPLSIAAVSSETVSCDSVRRDFKIENTTVNVPPDRIRAAYFCKTIYNREPLGENISNIEGDCRRGRTPRRRILSLDMFSYIAIRRDLEMLFIFRYGNIFIPPWGD